MIVIISLPAPYIGALMWENFSPQLPFMITAVVALLSIIPIWLFFNVPEKGEDGPEAGETLPLAEVVSD